jgi:hypothetical protein
MTTVAEAHAIALQIRFDHLISQMRLVEAQTPQVARAKVREVMDELLRIRRDLSGLEGELPPPVACSRPAGSMLNLRRSNEGRHALKERAGQRHCPKHDEGEGAWLPLGAFGVKNPATGALKSWCIECTKAYQRERYVAVTAKTMTVELIEGDRCVGHDCPSCGLPFEIGERITGENLHHEGCAA